MSHLADTDQHHKIVAALSVGLWSALSWLRGDGVTDDRGSDSSEKAFMVILSITLGGIVTGAAVAYVTTQTALFR